MKKAIILFSILTTVFLYAAQSQAADTKQSSKQSSQQSLSQSSAQKTIRCFVRGKARSYYRTKNSSSY